MYSRSVSGSNKQRMCFQQSFEKYAVDAALSPHCLNSCGNFEFVCCGHSFVALSTSVNIANQTSTELHIKDKNRTLPCNDAPQKNASASEFNCVFALSACVCVFGAQVVSSDHFFLIRCKDCHRQRFCCTSNSFHSTLSLSLFLRLSLSHSLFFFFSAFLFFPFVFFVFISSFCFSLAFSYVFVFQFSSVFTRSIQRLDFSIFYFSPPNFLFLRFLTAQNARTVIFKAFLLG